VESYFGFIKDATNPVTKTLARKNKLPMKKT
jgi:hypothetical protein